MASLGKQVGSEATTNTVLTQGKTKWYEGKGKKMMTDMKEATTAGLDKAKAATNAGVDKAKEGTASAVKWIKSFYEKEEDTPK